MVINKLVCIISMKYFKGLFWCETTWSKVLPIDPYEMCSTNNVIQMEDNHARPPAHVFIHIDNPHAHVIIRPVSNTKTPVDEGTHIEITMESE